MKIFSFIILITFYFNINLLAKDDDPQYLRILQQRNQLKNTQIQLKVKALTSKDFYKNILNDLSNVNDDSAKVYKIINWYTANLNYQNQLDQFILSKQAFIIQKTHKYVNLLKKHLKNKNIIKKRWNEIFTYLDEKHITWNKHKNELSNPKLKAKRLYSFADYFKGIDKISNTLKNFYQNKNIVNNLEIKNSIKDNLNQFIDLISNQFFYRTFNLLCGVVSYGEIHLTIFAPESWQIGSIAFRFNYLMKSLGNFNNQKVKIIGKENLPQNNIPFLNDKKDNKIINLILPSHRNHDADADTVLLANLNLPHFLIFANPKAFIKNRYLAQRLASRKGFISVGKWRGKGNPRPYQKVINALKLGISDTLINYPQGFTAITGEHLAVNNSFDKKLLRYLKAQGYKLNIIPVSYEVHSAFAVGKKIDDNKLLKAKVHKPITPHVSNYLLEIAQNHNLKNIFGVILRSIWIDNITEKKPLTIEDLHRRVFGTIK